MYYFGSVCFLVISVLCSTIVKAQSDHELDIFKEPKLFVMDDFDRCFLAAKDKPLYCVLDFDLLPPENPNAMYQYLKKKSDPFHTFNYTQLHRAICLTSRCKQYLPSTFRHTTDVQEIAPIIEKCYNDFLWNEFQMKAKISRFYNCNDGTPIEWEWLTIDYAILTGVAFIVLLNVIATILDVYMKTENSWILTFSMRKNWKNLVKPFDEKDKKSGAFDSMYFIRVAVIYIVIATHTFLLGSLVYIENSESYEEFTRGTENVAMCQQFFFVMSGFLMAHNFMKHAEKYQLSLWKIPVDILQRWWRLAPTVIFAAALRSGTWVSDAAEGALGVYSQPGERDACLNNGGLIAHAMLMYNYLSPYPVCFAEAWHSSADFQLTALGLIILVLAKRNKFSVLSGALFMLIVSAAIKFLTTVALDLKPTYVIYTVKYFLQTAFVDTPEFRYNYVTAQSNAPSYAIGIALAYFYRKGELRGIDLSKNKLFRCIYYLTPVMILWIIVDMHKYVAPLGPYEGKYVTATFLVVSQVLFALVFSIFLVGSFCVKDTLRKIMCWRWFKVLTKLTYGALVTHMTVIGIDHSTRNFPYFFTRSQYLNTLLGTLVQGFLWAIPVHILVEEPCYNFWKKVSVKLEERLEIKKVLPIRGRKEE